MTTISRVLFNAEVDDAASVLDDVLRAITPWALGIEGAAALEIPEKSLQPGAVTVRVGEHRLKRRLNLRRFDEHSGFILHAADRDLDGHVVDARITVVFGEGRLHVWVEHEADVGEYAAVEVPDRPALVRALLSVGSDHRIGSTDIGPEVTDYFRGSVSDLVDHLNDQFRRVPVVVVTCGYREYYDADRKRADELLSRILGLALVVALDADAQEELKALLPGMAVWGGAIRLYTAGNMSNSRAHPFYPRDMLRVDGIDRVAAQVERQSADLLPHKVLRDFLDNVEAGEEVSLEEENEELRRRIDGLRDELTRLRLHVEECEEARNLLAGQVERLRRAGIEAGRGDEVSELAAAGPDGPDDTVDSIEEAILQAQVYLSDTLIIPREAAQDIEKLQAHPNASVWANTLWRGLQSLHRYARENRDGSFPGGFYLWCQNSGHATFNPAKVAMKESDTVRQSARYRHQRLFPCDNRVEGVEDGRIFMESHLKIAEGGGPLAPRVYFIDDLAGATGKIHIGFIGPHDMVSNTRTS